MERHRLVERAAPSDLLCVVSEICGLHAQLMSSAELSLWARIDGLERDAVRDALWKQRALVKLWAMRGTLHLLPSAELGVWLSALGTYLKAIAFRGLLCFAPSDDGRVRFTTPATWIPGGIGRTDPVDALREITRRFLGAYAPVAVGDVARWWGGSRTARGARMLAALGEEAVEVDVEGQRAWVLARDVRELACAESPRAARLLPAFDPWVVGASRGAAALLEPRHKARVYRGQGWISPVVLVNGRMVGVWRHARKGRRLLVEIEPFGRLPAWARTQVEAESERLAVFLDGELELNWRPKGSRGQR